MTLTGKAAWAAGRSSGIGVAVARELLCRGATVAISARREDRLPEAPGRDMLVMPVDVTSAAPGVAAAARVRESSDPPTSRYPAPDGQQVRRPQARTGAGLRRAASRRTLRS